MASEVSKEDLDGMVAGLTSAFAELKEPTVISITNIHKKIDDYQHYFQKGQEEVKRVIQEETARVNKVKAEVKALSANNNHADTSSALQKQIASTLSSTTSYENRIEELKQLNEQV